MFKPLREIVAERWRAENSLHEVVGRRGYATVHDVSEETGLVLEVVKSIVSRHYQEWGYRRVERKPT